ncbi:hypothetical protein DTO212C5_8187 [Paecilomyces variotii]|nr:hypothetical protein DTO212C5_8187 [Paecilomyces variotii]
MPSLLRNSPVVAAVPATCFQPTSVRCDPRCLFFVPGGFPVAALSCCCNFQAGIRYQLTDVTLITSSSHLPPRPHPTLARPRPCFSVLAAKRSHSDSVITARL